MNFPDSYHKKSRELSDTPESNKTSEVMAWRNWTVHPYTEKFLEKLREHRAILINQQNALLSNPTVDDRIVRIAAMKVYSIDKILELVNELTITK